jgi:hypothetical protein
MDNNLKVEIISGITLALLVTIKYLREYFVDYLFSPIKKWFKKDRLDAVAVTSGRTVNNLLFELRLKTNADRTSLFLFHNGQHFNPKIINNSIWKFTCAYENCKDGVSYESAKMQNLLVTNHIALIESLWGKLDDGYHKYTCPDCIQDCSETKNIIIVIDVDKLPYGITKGILEMQGVTKFIISPIIIDGDYVGFLSMSYTNNFAYGSQLVANDKQNNLKGLKIICDFANKIGYHLSQKN